MKKAHQVAITCSLAATITGGPTAGTTVAFVKESSGGSNEGTFYEATGTALNFLDVSQTPTCTDAGAVAAAFYYTHQQAIADEQDACTGTFASLVAQIGLADEDPPLFNLGLQAISAANIAKLNTTPLFQNTFGAAVSLNLYRALQRAQGLALDDTLANMPTLHRATIASLLSGNVLGTVRA